MRNSGIRVALKRVISCIVLVGCEQEESAYDFIMCTKCLKNISAIWPRNFILRNFS